MWISAVVGIRLPVKSCRMSRFRRTVPLMKKSEAEEEIQRWIVELKAMGMRVEALRKDGGREFRSSRFKQ
jgi:hypothetical protein